MSKKRTSVRQWPSPRIWWKRLRTFGRGNSTSTTSANVTKTRQLNLCISCEACAAVCPEDAIKMVYYAGQFLPYVDREKCNQCGLCLECCPGINLDPLILSQDIVTPEALYGQVLGAYTAYIKDLDIRRNSTSGGLVTGMILELLRQNQYDAAFVLPFATFDEHPARLIATNQSGEIVAAAKSKYVTASIYNVITVLRQNQSNMRYIIVATPCQLRAIKQAMALARASGDNHLFLGLFCDRTMNFNFLSYIEDRYGEPGERLLRFEFRTKEDCGWPGNCKVVFDSGRSLFIHRRERMGVKTRFQLERCLYCIDKLNTAADISFGDCYIEGKADFYGRSNVIVRSTKGKQVFESCRDLLVIEEEPMRGIRDSQGLTDRLSNLDQAKIMMQKTGLFPDAVADYTAPSAAVRRLSLLQRQIELGRSYRSSKKRRLIMMPKIGKGVDRMKAALSIVRAFLLPLACLGECAVAGIFRRRSLPSSNERGHMVVLGASFTNKGSQAMLFTVVDQVRKRFPDKNIYMLSPFPSQAHEKDIYRFTILPWDFGTQIRVSSRLGRVLTGRRHYSETERKVAQVIRNAGCFIDISGFAISTQWGRSYYGSLFAYLINILIARKNSIPFYIFPQSMGPFDYPFYARLLLYPFMKLAFSYPKKFYLRERECLKYVYPFTKENVEWCLDIVLQGDNYDLSNIYSSDTDIASIAIPAGSVALIPNQRVVDRTDEGKLYSIYAAIIKELLSSRKKVYIIRHSHEDLDICTRIKSIFFDDMRVELLTKDLSCIQLEEMLKQFDFVIASRYHAIIHSYKNGVPVLVIGWAIKYPSLMREFGQLEYHFDCRNEMNAADVIGALQRLIANYQSEKQILLDKVCLVRRSSVFDVLNLEQGCSRITSRKRTPRESR